MINLSNGWLVKALFLFRFHHVFFLVFCRVFPPILLIFLCFFTNFLLSSFFFFFFFFTFLVSFLVSFLFIIANFLCFIINSSFSSLYPSLCTSYFAFCQFLLVLLFHSIICVFGLRFIHTLLRVYETKTEDRISVMHMLSRVCFDAIMEAIFGLRIIHILL